MSTVFAFAISAIPTRTRTRKSGLVFENLNLAHPHFQAPSKNTGRASRRSPANRLLFFIRFGGDSAQQLANQVS